MDHDSGARPRDARHLHDRVALDEIDLYAEVLIAVADADGPLSPAEIDRVLGVVRDTGGRSAAGNEPAGPPPGAEQPRLPEPRPLPDQRTLARGSAALGTTDLSTAVSAAVRRRSVMWAGP
ncbi:hypothetical protein [Nocardiopsis sp. FIRDI 009]|uniref:hypothetical protein n=1 Tax=Nocardiopsis sp. FIRDI 009 TaxID=714197 RepID=UPI000E21D455|nr:hypothetical protein [Nocardiopsis sp. FIRDI 009]